MAHEVLEQLMQATMKAGLPTVPPSARVVARDFMKREHDFKVPDAMMNHGVDAANFILSKADKADAQALAEVRVYLKFVHEEMFGTFDGAILDHFGTLHIFDYKYGVKAVSAKENLQMIFYAMGLAYLYNWNFKNVRLWIIQPRVKGYNGPTFWDMSVKELRAYVPLFKEAVERVETSPDLNEGDWCHWCKAKAICPLKTSAKLDQARLLFSPIGSVKHGKKEGGEKPWEEKSREEKLESLFKAKSKSGKEDREKEKARDEAKLAEAQRIFSGGRTTATGRSR